MPKIRILPRGTEIQVAPDAVTGKTLAVPAAEVPMIGTVNLVPVGDNTFRAVIRTHDTWLKLMQAAREFDVNHEVLRRLMRAGFIEGMQRSPGCYVINVQSYWQFIDAVRRDPEYWNEARRHRYASAL